MRRFFNTVIFFAVQKNLTAPSIRGLNYHDDLMILPKQIIIITVKQFNTTARLVVTPFEYGGSVADPGCLSPIPDPDFYPTRIPDLGSWIQ